MHKFKVLSTLHYLLVPYTPDMPLTEEELVDGLVNLFTNPLVIQYNSSRQLSDQQEALDFILNSSYYGAMNHTTYDYFLIDKSSRMLIGSLHFLSPLVVVPNYPGLNLSISNNRDKDSTWVMEYYLHPSYWNRGIMSLFVGEMVKVLFDQGANYVCGLIDRDNLRSLRLVEKLGFKSSSFYKDKQGQILMIKGAPY